MVREVLDLFKECCPSLPCPRAVTSQRATAIKARLKEGYSLDDFKRAFELAESSDFLSGRNGKWKACSFDWIVAPRNFVKVIEGNYNREQRKELPPQKKSEWELSIEKEIKELGF